MEIDQILKCVDHTLLKQTAVFADVKKLHSPMPAPM